jgi:hypothetical protein
MVEMEERGEGAAFAIQINSSCFFGNCAFVEMRLGTSDSCMPVAVGSCH